MGVSPIFCLCCRFCGAGGVGLAAPGLTVAGNLEKIVEATVQGLGYELVELETGGRGLVRVYIDQPKGIAVGDCEKVSNHLTRVFAVENIEFDRLEVSSPGLDRPLKSEADFRRFGGALARIRLFAPVGGRKRFDAVLVSAEDGFVELELVEPSPAPSKRGHGQKAGKQSKAAVAPERPRLRVALDQIEKARLIPEI